MKITKKRHKEWLDALNKAYSLILHFADEEKQDPHYEDSELWDIIRLSERATEPLGCLIDKLRQDPDGENYYGIQIIESKEDTKKENQND